MNGSAVDAMLVVGKITGCYGLKGWVKIQSYTETPENFLGFGVWQLQRRGVFEPVEFDAVKRQGRGLVAHIAGVDDRALPPLPEGDYYWRDLQGLQVWCRVGNDRVLLGTVDYLIETGANDVLVVKACEGSIDTRERLIPYLPGVSVIRVDLEQALIEVDWFVDDE